MSDVAAFVRRNCLIYFRDKSSVIFSLMGALIVILLYLIFLRNMLVDSIISSMPASFPYEEGAVKGMVDAWVLSGVIAIVSVTTTAGAFQTMVQDKVDGKYLDGLMTTMSPLKISVSYVLSTFVIGLIMSVITFIISVIFLIASGTEVSMTGILLTLVLTVPASLSSSMIVYTIVCKMRSAGAFTGMYTILSVLIGFLTGTYMPIGTMDTVMQNISTMVPATHMASLMHRTLGTESFDVVMGGAPLETYADVWNTMGYELTMFGCDFTPMMSILYVFGMTALFFVIAVLINRKNC